MFSIDQTEEEQYDRLKAWVKKNRKVLIGGIAALFVTVFGVQYQEHRQLKQATAAANLFTEFLEYAGNKEGTDAGASLETLKDKYASSSYTAMASLLKAQMDVGTQSLDAAKTELEWVKSQCAQPWQDLAVLRLAKLAVQGGDAATAKTLLETVKSGPYVTLARELEGDVALQQGEIAVAKAAYQGAFSSAPAPLGWRPFLRVKMEDVGLGIPAAS